ncbi:hemin uptake protein HemP [Pseudaminobacter sp. 19-2017]|uniref:Hemin uptake protein HemP n=1 Tax=Pseudaminobacter soli (ex Zhang et al. 2022) TaxID=2831468 RepID=A0A942DUU8_9HYPH|nr:hemin uptake protein HemP [Pseudaminobacter soli]MBS3647514.1 hemin uptake protein HemP [Pseudaminobacter soli]
MNTHSPNSFLRRSKLVTLELRKEPQESYRGAVRTVSSQSLFQGEHEIGIDHAGSLYRLKITRQGKLILNK